jgi:hypothetical protein
LPPPHEALAQTPLSQTPLSQTPHPSDATPHAASSHPPMVQTDHDTTHPLSAMPSLVHQFPTVGHYQCPCGLPICTAAAKCRSLGGYPTFCRYFGPSLQLQLTLPTGGSFGGTAVFHATCASCGIAIGYVPLTTAVLCCTGERGGNTSSLDGGEGVHALRITCTAMCYKGQKAPPEYLSLEVAALSTMDDTTGPKVDPGRRGSMRGPPRTVPHDLTTDEDESSDEDGDRDDEDDDALWIALRVKAKTVS